MIRESHSSPAGPTVKIRHLQSQIVGVFFYVPGFCLVGGVIWTSYFTLQLIITGLSSCSRFRANSSNSAEDRYDRKSTIITSQLPVSNWYEVIAEKPIADAILDRLVHKAYRLTLNGESMRKTRKNRK